MSGTFHKVSMSTTFQNIEGAEDGETMNLKGEMRGSQSSGPVLSWDMDAETDYRNKVHICSDSIDSFWLKGRNTEMEGEALDYVLLFKNPLIFRPVEKQKQE